MRFVKTLAFLGGFAPQTPHRERYAPQPPTYWVTRWPLNCGATLRPVLVCIGCESSLQNSKGFHIGTLAKKDSVEELK